MKILSREPQSATSNEVAQLLPAFANKDIHSFISTTSLQDLDGLSYLPDWTDVLNAMDEFLEEATKTRTIFLFESSPASMEVDNDDSSVSEKLLAMLRFTATLLRVSFGKEVYSSVEHLLVLTHAINDDIAYEAVNCIYALASFPDNHHSVVLEDRHLTFLHKNHQLLWPLFQIVESMYPRVVQPEELGGPYESVAPQSVDIVFDTLGGPPFSMSPLATVVGSDDQVLPKVAFSIDLSGDGLERDYSFVPSTVGRQARFCAQWTLRSIYWRTSREGRARMLSTMYRLCYTILSCYPEYAHIVSFFQDKLRLLKDFVNLVATMTYTDERQPDDLMELRIIACTCISALLDTKDQSSSPIGLQYPWLFQDLGVHRGQYMGLIPCQLRSCFSALQKTRKRLSEQFGGRSVRNCDLTARDRMEYVWAERLIIVVYYLSNLNISLPSLLENGLIASMLSVVNVTEEVLFPFQMWMDNMALTIMESVMTPNTVIHASFRDQDGPEIVLRRMEGVISAFVASSGGKPLPASQISLLQQFISLISCYMQEARSDGDDGQLGLLYRNPHLQTAFNLVFDNSSQMHSSVLSATTALIAEIMNRDLAPPSCVNWMLSQGLVKKAFEVQGTKPSIANSDLPLASVSLASAVSLTADGVSLVQESKVLELTLEYLGDSQNYLPYSLNLMTDQASSLGATMEELLRHYPVYVDPVINTLISLAVSVCDRAMQVRQSLAHDFVFNEHNFNYSPEFSALLHCGVALSSCLEPILSRKESSVVFLRQGGLDALLKLKSLSLGTLHQLLVSTSCALEGTSPSLGYSVLVGAVLRCVHHLAENCSTQLVNESVERILEQQRVVEEAVGQFKQSRSSEHTAGSLFHGLIDCLPTGPIHLLQKTDDVVSSMYTFAHCLVAISQLDFLHEVFGSVQGGRNSRRVHAGDLLNDELAPRLIAMLQNGMSRIYLPSQEEMSRYRAKKRISGLSTPAVTEQPVFLLLITSEFAIFRQTIDDSSKRTGKVIRGTIVEATERKCSSNGMVKYRTKFGWISHTRGSTLLDPQVMIIDVRRRCDRDEAEATSIVTVQQRFEQDKYSNISIRRASLFALYGHHVSVRNSLVTTFARVFGPKDMSGVLSTSTSQVREFMVKFLPPIRESIVTLLPPFSKQYPEFHVDSFLGSWTEEKIAAIESSDDWMQQFAFAFPAISLEDFDVDKILSASRAMELFRSLLFDSKKSKGLSPYMMVLLTHLLKTSSIIDDLLMTTAFLLQITCGGPTEPVSDDPTSAPNEMSQRLLERKLIALPTLDQAMDIWKQLIHCLVYVPLGSPEAVSRGMLARVVFSMVRAFYSAWSSDAFHSIPSSITKLILEIFSYIFRGLYDINAPVVESEVRQMIASSRTAAAQRSARSTRQPLFQPDATAVQTCVDMGFDQRTVTRAMRALRSNDVNIVVPYLVENPFGDMYDDEAAEEATGNEAADGAAAGDAPDAPDGPATAGTEAVVPSLRLLSTRGASALLPDEDLSRIAVDQPVAKKLQPAVYGVCRRFAVRVIKSGAATSDGVLDAELIASNAQVDRNVFTVMVLNGTLKALENFSWTEMSMRLMLLSWMAGEAVTVLSSSHEDGNAAHALYGLLQAMSVLLSSRIVNGSHYRPMQVNSEVFLLVLHYDPRFEKLQSLLIAKLRSFFIDAAMLQGALANTSKWILPALVVLSYMNQSVLCDANNIDVVVRDAQNFLKSNPERSTDLESLLCSPQTLLSAEVKKKISDYAPTAESATLSLPLVESPLPVDEKKRCAELALKVLSWLDTGANDASKVAELSSPATFAGQVARAAMQLLVHLMGAPALRDFCQQEKVLHVLFNLRVSFDGLHQIMFSVLQRYLEDESYLKQSMRVILKLIYDRLAKGGSALLLSTFMEVASPLLYRNQTLFFEELQEVFTLTKTNFISIKPKDKAPAPPTTATPATPAEPTVASSATEASEPVRQDSKSDPDADLHVAKRMRTERASIATKVEAEMVTPRKRRSESHGKISRVALVQELIDYLVSEIARKWLELRVAQDSASTEPFKAPSLLGLADCFLMLADLVATFPFVATCVHRSKIREEALFHQIGRYADRTMKMPSDFNFLAFVLQHVVQSSLLDTLKAAATASSATTSSDASPTAAQVDAIMDSCFYFLAAIVSRPGEGRMSLIALLGDTFVKMNATTPATEVARMTELLDAFLVPPVKWANRELFLLPAKEIASAFIACDMHKKLIALFNKMKLRASGGADEEKVLQALSSPIDILLRRRYPAFAPTSSPIDRRPRPVGGGAPTAIDNVTTAAEPSAPAAAPEDDHWRNQLHEFHQQLMVRPESPSQRANETFHSDDEDDAPAHDHGGHDHFFAEGDDDDDDGGADEDEDMDEDDEEDEDDHDEDLIDHGMHGAHHHHHHHHEEIVMDDESEDSHSSHSDDASSLNASEREDDEGHDDDVEGLGDPAHGEILDDGLDGDDDGDDLDDHGDLDEDEHEAHMDDEDEDDMDGDDDHGDGEMIDGADDGDEDDGEDDAEGDEDDEEVLDFDNEAAQEESFAYNIASDAAHRLGAADMIGHDFHDGDDGETDPVRFRSFHLRDGLSASLPSNIRGMFRRGRDDGDERYGDGEDEGEEEAEAEMAEAMQMFRENGLELAGGGGNRRGRDVRRNRTALRLRDLAQEAHAARAAGHHAAVHIRVAGVNGGDQISFNDVQELFGGLLPEGLRPDNDGNFAIEIDDMGGGHEFPVTSSQQLRPHPLMDAVDNRRSRVHNSSGLNSFNFMLGGGSQSREYPFFSYESQMKQQRSQMPAQRKALGPLVSDRRWGTDLNDMDLPGARASGVSSGVEQYLQAKVFGHFPQRFDRLGGGSFLSFQRSRGGRGADGGESLLRMAGLPITRSIFGGGHALNARGSTAVHEFSFDRLFGDHRVAESKEEEGEPLIESKEDEPVATSTSSAAAATAAPAPSSSSAATATTATVTAPAAIEERREEAAVVEPSTGDEVGDEAIDEEAIDEEGDEMDDDDDDGDDEEHDEDDDDGFHDGDDDGDVFEEVGDDDDEDGDEPEDDGDDDDDDDDDVDDGMDVEETHEEAHGDAPDEDNENLAFLNSVPQELRTEILLTAEQEFLNTLPRAVQEEARAIRDSHAMQFQMFNYNTNTQPPVRIIPADAPAPAAPTAAPATTAPVTAATAGAAGSGAEVAAPSTSAVAPVSSAAVAATAPVPTTAPAVAPPKPVNTSAWYIGKDGNPAKDICFDASFLVRLVQWVATSKQERVTHKFRLLATVCSFDICRKETLRILVALMLNDAAHVRRALVNFATQTATTLADAELDEMVAICSQLAGSMDTYRRVLLAINQLIKRTGYLTILEFFEADPESTAAEQKSIFKLLLRCLRRAEMSSLDIDRTLQVIEKLCKHFQRLSSEQTNQLVAVQTSGESDAAVSTTASTSALSPAGVAVVESRPEPRPDPLAHSDSVSTMGQLLREAQVARARPAAASVPLHNKRRMTYPVLSKEEALLLISVFVNSDCGGVSKRVFHKIFRYLSLSDGNWRLFLESLAEDASDLVCLSTVEFTALDNALDDAHQQQEDMATVMARREFNSPQVLQESKLLGVLKLMTILRSRSSAAAAAESEIIAEYLREIPTNDLWELLCACLEKVAAIEELDLEKESRRRGRARTLSFSSAATSTAAALADVSRPATASSATTTAANSKPISTLTMRFIPLIEFFLSAFSRTLITSPPAQTPAGRATGAESTSHGPLSGVTPSHGVELVRMNSNALPGSRFRQSSAFLSMQLEISEDSSASKLVKFAEKHHDLLNKVLRSNIHLLETTFSPLVNVTKLRALLHFDIKRAFFKSKLKRLRSSSTRMYGGSLKITVRRSHIFEDSFNNLRYKSADEMRRRLSVSFHNEEGVDAGGLTREWYNVLAREIFNANYALFLSTGDGVTFQPNPHSSVNTEHLFYFKFVGRVIGKAISDGFLLDAHFTRSFYKHMLGLPVNLQDLEAIEPAYYKSLQQLLDTPLEYLGLDLAFSAETTEFGAITITDLIPGGRDIAVTDDTKHEYVRLLAHHRMTTAIRKQIDAFLEGFHELVPAELISIFDASELELLISGLPDIDLDDLRAHTDYGGGYKSSDPIINWFWSALRSFSKEEKALFLQFVTGTSKVPLDGFKALHGSDGIRKFNIQRAFGGDSKLPAAHTCFNTLDLPEYTSEEVLRERMLLAIREGSEGFGFA